MSYFKRALGNFKNKKLRNQIYALKEFLISLPRPILVYQMGKVGSTSVYRSLKQSDLPALHVHKIGPRKDYAYDFYTQNNIPPSIDLYVGQLLHAYLKLSSVRFRVISMVRDPVSRYLSKLYHDPDLYDMIASQKHQTLKNVINHLSKPDTFEQGMFKWFDRELKSNFNIDVMNEPFDKEKGYTEYQNSRVDIIILKTEYLSEYIPTVLSDFVNKSLENVQVNVGEKKKSGSDYKHIQRSFTLPVDILERIYEHSWVRHFYTEKEIIAFKKKWSTA